MSYSGDINGGVCAIVEMVVVVKVEFGTRSVQFVLCVWEFGCRIKGLRW